MTREIDDRERAMQRASELLGRIMPFERWVASLSDDRKAAIVSALGSLEAAYRPLVRSLEREVADPSPTVVRDTPNGVEYGWQPGL